MNEALKAYLAQCDSAKLDPEFLEAHLRAMTEEVIPAIVDDLREANRVAVELRYSPAVRLMYDSAHFI